MVAQWVREAAVLRESGAGREVVFESQYPEATHADARGEPVRNRHMRAFLSQRDVVGHGLATACNHLPRVCDERCRRFRKKGTRESNALSVNFRLPNEPSSETTIQPRLGARDVGCFHYLVGRVRHDHPVAANVTV